MEERPPPADVCIKMNIDDYFDLTNSSHNVEELIIKRVSDYNCVLANSNSEKIYSGFLLAKSPAGNRFTLCDVDFQRSSTDGRCQPRLIFRRSKVEDGSLPDVVPPANSEYVRLPFSNGKEGYREFWKMIFFLYKFKEEIDFGEFDNMYQVVTSEQVSQYFNNKTDYEEITRTAKALNIEVSTILRSSTTLKILKSYRERLNRFISDGASETDVQNWIDEDEHKYRQQRCMIFGLEYIDFKREGSTSSKKFDVLTRVGSKYIEYVIIELKSPSDDIFETETDITINNDTYKYKIHKELARAIPQVLEYKSTLEAKEAGDPELEKLGIKGKPKIAKCVVVIGKHQEDERWQKNRSNLVKSLNSSLEIWTYAELLNKIDATIENLERNITEETSD